MGYTTEGLDELPGYQGLVVTHVKLVLLDGTVENFEFAALIVDNKIRSPAGFEKNSK